MPLLLVWELSLRKTFVCAKMALPSFIDMQILKIQNNNSYPLLLGAPYMIAVEDLSVRAAATLSLEGLAVKDGKVFRFSIFSTTGEGKTRGHTMASYSDTRHSLCQG